MVKELLPRDLGEVVASKYNFAGIYEFRIRSGMPILINYLGEYIILRNLKSELMIADKKLVEYILARATDLSLYKYNNQIKNGFISVSGGVRIGISGEVVLGEDGIIKTLKNYSGLVIRVPHQIKGCSQKIMPYILDESGLKNTLIISPPGCGKTTLLRDVAREISHQDRVYNILIVDERYELAASENGVNTLDVGFMTDVLSGTSKEFGFYDGIRALRPDVIITDELATKNDVNAVKYAKNSGVKVVASVHGSSHLDIKQKTYFCSAIVERTFDRYVVLSDRNGVGTIEYILNSAFEPMWVNE